jgi:hypothetical protein
MNRSELISALETISHNWNLQKQERQAAREMKDRIQGLGFLVEESDPLFLASVAAKLTEADLKFLRALPLLLTRLQGKPGKDGKDGRDGRDGKRGPTGVAGKDGRDASVEEMHAIAKDSLDSHEKTHDHALLHDPHLLGTKKVTEEGMQKDTFLKYDGEKLVYAELPQPKEERRIFHSSGSSLSDYFRVTRTVTESSTIQPEDRIVHVDATSGNITLTLHTASGHDRRSHYLKRIDSSSNTVTIVPTGNETIEFLTSDQLPNQGSSRMFYAHEGAWYLMH